MAIFSVTPEESKDVGVKLGNHWMCKLSSKIGPLGNWTVTRPLGKSKFYTSDQLICSLLAKSGSLNISVFETF